VNIHCHNLWGVIMKSILSLTLLFSLVASACGAQVTPGKPLSIREPIQPSSAETVKADIQDPEVKTHFDNFFSDADYFNATARRDIISKVSWMSDEWIKSSKKRETVIGNCSVLVFKGRVEAGSGQLLIRKLWWDNASELERDILMKHELGHCVLNKGHDPTGSATIMAPSMLAKQEIESYYSWLVRDLFTRAGTAMYLSPIAIGLDNKPTESYRLEFDVASDSLKQP